ncbi:MAG TPA: hypothetical protein VF173_17715 [Thermoanaerobaculia bacterium]|nr:hypothetical protein [Thermoanaerobaculia bacterium]
MDAETMLHNARRSLLSADLSAARALLKDFLSTQQESDISLVALRFYLEKEDVPKARLVASKILQKNPTAEAFYLASQIALTDRQQVEFLENAIKLDPFHARAVATLEALTVPRERAHQDTPRPIGPTESGSKYYGLLRGVFFLGFALDFIKAFVPSRKYFIMFLGQTAWASQIEGLQAAGQLGREDTWVTFAAIAAAAGFALLAIKSPSRKVFVLGAVFSLYQLTQRWGMTANSLIEYHPIYVAVSYLVIAMQFTGFFIVPPERPVNRGLR